MLHGQSPEIMTVKRMIREIAKTGNNALIIGEVGSGKERTAREIHNRSNQKNRPFIVLNCTAIGDTITESDLYGETVEGERGLERKIGILEQAKNGILYMNDVDELKPEFQQKFLNIIREKRFRRSGEETAVESDFRILSATEDENLVKNSSFRGDFLSMLNTFTIHVPPLRKRKQDIPTLFTHFLETFCEEFNREIPTVPSELFESMMEYEWRGNVQELETAVRNLVLMSPEGQLSIEYLPFEIKKHPFEFLDDRDLPEAVSEVEKYLIRKALQKFAGNQTKAAHALNVSEAALRYKMKKYGMSRKAY
jgi:DNA-binding NtrC family response regulator